jgi:cobaltochelatase CobS
MTEKGNALESNGIPDTEVDVRETFGLDIDLKVPAFSRKSDHVPEIDKSYLFNFETTLAILAGLRITVE